MNIPSVGIKSLYRVNELKLEQTTINNDEHNI